MTLLPIYLMHTHALYWRRMGSPKLSKPAAGTFQEGIAGKATLIVHHVAVAELFYIAAKRLGATMVTRDPLIQASSQVQCLW